MIHRKWAGVNRADKWGGGDTGTRGGHKTPGQESYQLSNQWVSPTAKLQAHISHILRGEWKPGNILYFSFLQVSKLLPNT